ncbi:MAG: chemotaxis protein CheW [Phycisphaerae bacterium]|nr:chemotaxis protein CheW [Phycisphaerae bacterium]
MRVLLFDTFQPDGTRRWALRAAEIVELLPVVRWRRVDGGPAWALGVFERHGELVPLLDLPQILGDVATSPRVGARIALMRITAPSTGGVDTSRGLVGFLLSNTAGLAQIDFASASAYPGFDPSRRTPLGPIAKTPDGFVQLIETEHAFGNAEREALLPACNVEPAP